MGLVALLLLPVEPPPPPPLEGDDLDGSVLLPFPLELYPLFEPPLPPELEPLDPPYSGLKDVQYKMRVKELTCYKMHMCPPNIIYIIYRR